MLLDNSDIKVVAFDADDTLWISETYFYNMEKNFIQLMAPFMQPEKIHEEFYKVEMQNISIFGYGIKGYTLSMIESAIKISRGKLNISDIQKILDMCKSILTSPIEIIPGVKAVLKELGNDYKLVLVTKGDLLDQENKLKSSGLVEYFHHIEILSEKNDDNYKKLITQLNINPDEFLMIGNSLKSDILPVLSIGGKAIHVPFHITWDFEHCNIDELKHLNYLKVENVEDVLFFLRRL